MAKRIVTAFAQLGDRDSIPDTQSGEDVNYQTGYTAPYEADPETEPTAKLVERDKTNQLFNDITSNIKEWQEQAFPNFINAIDNGGVAFPYTAGTVVKYSGKNYKSLVDNNQTIPTSSDWAEFGSASALSVAVKGSVNTDAQSLFDTTIAAGDPVYYGAVYGTVDDTQKAANSVALQACIDNNNVVTFTGLLEKIGSNTLRSNMEFKGYSRSTGVIDYSPSSPCFIDSTLTAPNAQGNNTVDVVFDGVHVRSINDNCFHMTPYQCKWSSCFFRADNGTVFKIHDGGYQVENKWEDNYFFDFIIAVEASEGGDSRFRKMTDAFFKDNYYYDNANPNTEYALDIYGGSGGLIDGDHYYGDYLVNMVRTGGINLRIVNCYFEAMTQPRLYLQGGNPSGVTVSNCTFWRGDGSATNLNGDVAGLIEVRYSAFNRSMVTFSGNVFEGGTNAAPIFIIKNGDDDNSTFHKVSFDKSNILNGSYSKATISVTGDATNTWSIQSDHNELWEYFTADDANPWEKNCSEIMVEDSENDIEYALLPTWSNWLGNKEVIINMIGENTILSLQNRAAGDGYVGVNDLLPGGRYRLTQRRLSGTDDVYFCQSMGAGSASNGATLSKYNGLTFAFPAGPLAAGEEVRVLVDVGDGPITDDSLNIVVNLKALANGIVQSTYFDSATDNRWKVKIANVSSSSVTVGTYTGNVTIIE